MASPSLFSAASRAFVLAEYLSAFHEKVGANSYLASHIRSEHGTGRGFFGVSNTGSSDSLKEQFRRITDALGQNYKTPEKITFRSERCITITKHSEAIHRVEHTREVSDLFKLFEEQCIMKNVHLTAHSLAKWVIENQIVCLIEISEQKKKRLANYNDEMPFSKYSGKVFFGSLDVTQLPLAALKQVNLQHFASELDALSRYDFDLTNEKQRKSLTRGMCPHTLPPMDLAIKHHSDEFELLDEHYVHKLQKRTNPEHKSWYSEADANSFREWKKQKASPAKGGAIWRDLL